MDLKKESERCMRTSRVVIVAVTLGLAACSSKSPTSSFTGGGGGGGPSGPAVTVADFQFSPDTITIAAGQSVLWTNNGPSTHTVTSDNSSWTSASLGAPGGTDPYGYPTGGGTFSHMFSSAGTYHYHCSIHAGMTAVVVVTP